MDRLSRQISAAESKLSELVAKPTLSKDDENAVGYLLTSILTSYFATLDRDSGMKGWSVDDMYPDDVKKTKNKLTLIGNIFWLGGGGKCKYYQADISTDTDPILYSVKLKNGKQKQVLYIAKTFTGWVMNET